MKQKPDLLLSLMVTAMLGIGASWLYMMCTKSSDDFPSKVEEVQPITINFLYWIGDSDVNRTCKPTDKN